MITPTQEEINNALDWADGSGSYFPILKIFAAAYRIQVEKAANYEMDLHATMKELKAAQNAILRRDKLNNPATEK